MSRTRPLAATALLAALVVAPAAWVAARNAQPSASAATYKVDPVHSTAVFRTTHLGVGASWGRINDPQGTFTTSADGVTFDVQLDPAKVDTFNKKRDDHLRGADFFNVEQFPQWTFKSTGSRRVSDGKYEVTGTLTIKGVSKQVTVPMSFIGEGQDPWGKYRAGFEATFVINRMDYGISYMPDGLGKEVTVIVALEGTRQ